MNDVQALITCVYCGGDARIYEKDARHPFAHDQDVCQIYQCSSCASIITHPVPGAEVLNAMYSSFDKGMHSKARELRTKFPLVSWFRQCLEHMMKDVSMSPDFSWIDIGAGEGEMSNLVNSEFPSHKGTAVDFHARPDGLSEGVNWVRGDLNAQWPTSIEPADLVFSITVFEHIADPVHFLRSSLDLLKSGGVFYFNCPRADSAAFRIMGKKWPYYLPGEHLTIPSITGLEKLMKRECERKFGDQFVLTIRPVIMPYPIGYYLGYFFPFMSRFSSLKKNVYIPTGILECKLILNR